MAAVLGLYLSCVYIAITKEPLDISKRNSAQTQIVMILTNSVWNVVYRSTVISMEKRRIF